MKTTDTNIAERSQPELAADPLKQAAQRELAEGVLKQAAHDLRRFHNASTKIERELYFDAYSWVMSDDCSWPFSFLNVCRILKRRPNELREELLGDLSLGFFSQWTRRGARAFHRLSDSLTQRFVTGPNESVDTSVSLMETSY